MSAHDRLRERLRQGRAAALRELGADVPAAAPSAEAIGRAFAPGARVFDRVTGLEGVVLSGTRENIIEPITERNDG